MFLLFLDTFGKGWKVDPESPSLVQLVVLSGELERATMWVDTGGCSSAGSNQDPQVPNVEQLHTTKTGSPPHRSNGKYMKTKMSGELGGQQRGRVVGGHWLL